MHACMHAYSYIMILSEEEQTERELIAYVPYAGMRPLNPKALLRFLLCLQDVKISTQMFLSVWACVGIQVVFKNATGHYTESGRAATTLVRPTFEFMRNTNSAGGDSKG